MSTRQKDLPQSRVVDTLNTVPNTLITKSPNQAYRKVIPTSPLHTEFTTREYATKEQFTTEFTTSSSRHLKLSFQKQPAHVLFRTKYCNIYTVLKSVVQVASLQKAAQKAVRDEWLR